MNFILIENAKIQALSTVREEDQEIQALAESAFDVQEFFAPLADYILDELDYPNDIPVIDCAETRQWCVKNDIQFTEVNR